MNLPFYDAYQNNLVQEPVEYWQDLMQQSIDDVWEDTSTLTNVEGQAMVGGTEYLSENIQLNSVIDPKTGSSLGDDFRKIIYQNYFDNKLPPDGSLGNLSKRFLGKYYKFDSNFWLTINTNTNIGALATAILQRCNNTLKWYDKNDVLHTWPCVFERTLNSTNFDWGSLGVPEVDASTVVKVQLNAETEAIPFNQRFIFDGHAFQVKQINNHISKTYMEIYLFEVITQPNDNIEDNIANDTGEVVSHITVTKLLPEISKILQGDAIEFNVFHYVDGTKNADSFTIRTSGPVLGTNYLVENITDNTFTIRNLKETQIPLTITCTNNNDSSDVVQIKILLGGLW